MSYRGVKNLMFRDYHSPSRAKVRDTQEQKEKVLQQVRCRLMDHEFYCGSF